MTQPGTETGDVVFVLRLRQHDTFHRSPSHSHPSLSSTSAPSADLFTTVHLTLSEALLGFSRVILRHLDGRGVFMSRQAQSESSVEGQGLPVRPGEVVVIRGEGMPIYDPARIKKQNAKGKTGNDDDIEKGDLYINFEIEMPSQEWLSNISSKVRPWPTCSAPVACFCCTSSFGLLLARPLWLFQGDASHPLPGRVFRALLRAPASSAPTAHSLRLRAWLFPLEALGVIEEAGKIQVSVHWALSAHTAGHGT